MKNSSKPHQYKLFSAFTLAEVLITLGIIGVVAAMTIPILINSYQKHEYITGLKKFYSNFNQSLKNLTIEEGCPDDLQCTGIYSTSSPNIDELLKYYKTSKNCKRSMGAGCWAKFNQYYDGTSTSSSTDNDMDNNPTYYKFITVDGMSVGIGNSFMFYNCESGATKTCGVLYVDVNGLKKPNRLGRDVFQFYVSNKQGALLYPRGGEHGYTASDWWNYSDANKCSSESSNADKDGIYCTGRIMEKNWVMDY